MRGDPCIPESTRQAIFRKAEELGYRPNPMVSVLMEHIRSGREVKEQGCLAILQTVSLRVSGAGPKTYVTQLDGFRRQAALRGYRTETFRLENSEKQIETLDRQLYARGIAGVLLAAPRHRSFSSPLPLQWNRYACSTVGYSWWEPAVDRVSSHHRHNVDMAVAKVLDRGYQRIGMCLPPNAHSRVESNWLAGYLVWESRLPRNRRIPLFEGTVTDSSREDFERWFRRWKPDVLITLVGEEAVWLRQLGIGFDQVGLVCLNLPPDSSLSGVVENNEDVGATACDIIVNKLAHNERGLPPRPRLILIDGSWRDGESLPGRRASGRGRIRRSPARAGAGVS
jgi:LacI family transcriptional regulator